MKKPNQWICGVTAAALIFSMAACGKDKAEGPENVPPKNITSAVGDGSGEGDAMTGTPGEGDAAPTDMPGEGDATVTETPENPEGDQIDKTIYILPSNRSETNGGRFEGWGTSLCWWANRIGYSDALAEQAAELFFGEDGLHMNIMRYNIGGGDDPTHRHITRTDSAVPGWMVYDEASQDYVYDYDADYNQLNVLRRAVEAAGEDAYVEVFSNSPPYFMTVSGCSTGHQDAWQNNLKDDSYEEFADYLGRVTKYINDDLGIRVSSISPMNEPDTGYWGANSWKQEGCHFDPGESQSKILVETAAALEKYGLSEVILVGSDETSPRTQINSYHSYTEEARAALGRISTHTYDSNGIAALGALAKEENFNLWMSEVDGDGTAGTGAGEMGSALWIAEKIISDMNALSPSAWVMWQIIDNHVSKDGYNGNKDSGMVNVNRGFWGAAVADHDEENIILTKKYYGIGQFTRYIRPGATIIHCGGGALAAYDAGKGELVVVVLNTSAKDQRCRVDLSMMDEIGSTVKAVRTSGSMQDGKNWAELPELEADESGFTAELKANSITTFRMEGVKMGDGELEKITLSNFVVTGSVPWNNGSDIAANVVDGNVDTFFDGVADGWLEIDLGEETKFQMIGYAPRAGYEYRMEAGKFYGSNDGENWDVLYEVTSVPAAGMNQAFLPAEVSYRYLRYDIPTGSPKGSSETYNCNIAEIALYRFK